MTDSHKSITNSNSVHAADQEEPLKTDTCVKKQEPSQLPVTTSTTPQTSAESTNNFENNFNTNTTSNLTPNKVKLNKEELKLSPIRKKSVSSSSLLEDMSSITQNDTTVSNGANNATPTNANNNSKSLSSEENKENDVVCKILQKLEDDCAVETIDDASAALVAHELVNGEKEQEEISEESEPEQKSKNGNKKNPQRLRLSIK